MLTTITADVFARVFGHLEKPFFLELCKFMESVKVQAGDYLFRVGDVDNCIYVVQSGLVEVFVKEKVRLKIVSHVLFLGTVA